MHHGHLSTVHRLQLERKLGSEFQDPFSSFKFMGAVEHAFCEHPSCVTLQVHSACDTLLVLVPLRSVCMVVAALARISVPMGGGSHSTRAEHMRIQCGANRTAAWGKAK